LTASSGFRDSRIQVEGLKGCQKIPLHPPFSKGEIFSRLLTFQREKQQTPPFGIGRLGGFPER
jgi:hypothetical protein